MKEPTIKVWNDTSIVKISEVSGFKKWLNGQTMPIVDSEEDPYDWAYAQDYERFKAHKPIVD